MIGELIGGGVRLLREQTWAVAIWGGLFAVLGIAMWLMIMPLMAPLAVYQMQAAQAAAIGAQPPMLPGQFWLTFLPIWLILILAIVAVFAAAMRATAWGGTDKLAFLRFGMDEFRLIGLGLLAFVVFFFGGIVLGIGIAIVGGSVAMLMGNASAASGGAVAMVMMLVLCGAMIWLNVRLSLIPAVTVLRGRFAIVDGWRATRGHFWTLFGAYVVLSLAFMVLWLVIMAVMQPAMLMAMLHGFNQAEIAEANAAQVAQFGQGLSVRMVIGWILSIGIGMITYPLTFGTIATAAIRFGRPDEVVETI